MSGKNIVQQSWKKSMERIGRELNVDFSGILPGRPRVLADGRVGKFGWKAQFATWKNLSPPPVPTRSAWATRAWTRRSPGCARSIRR